MNVTIRGDGIQVSESLEEFVLNKVDKLERYLPNITSVHIDLSHKNNNRGPDMVVAQITVKHQRGAILRSEERLEKEDRDSIRMAVNHAVDKMYRRIRRFKGKRENKRREAYVATLEELEIAEELPESVEPESESSEPEIIRRKNVPARAMNESEAIEQMELLGHTFFMFFNIDENAANVVYKRKNGGYGILALELE
ncbi:MAG: ribosome-associated translation inhibitor RaiA [Anaerolineae bacterium]|nr:ribosome-associated translation inhibitor RaiA [Anaerolineae bacterium]MCA9892201.1 ribosome-associated translation inhibitor RaiA [Anaerolineae bacterium]MCB9461895.1 ribosome-associated translation inhibitor RaiA [Anaerolineaceae bacterium]